MDNTLVKSFTFNNYQLTAIMKDGEPWFVAKDVCDILGYQNTSKAISDNCKDKGITNGKVITAGGKQSVKIINEGNLYRLVMRSKLPAAEPFEDWVVSEVLPSIRKQYMHDLIECGMGLIAAQPKEEGYFYIFDFGHIIKVGISQKSPEGRLQSHIHDLKKMRLPHAVKNELVVSLYNFMELETAIKRRYSAFATTEGGEWMRGVTFETLIAFTEGFKSSKGE